jgi:predicted DNA-binding protein (MmcQ/YjbR family)
MTKEELISYCLNKPGAWDDLPFDETTLVIKVGKKMFALFGEEEPARMNLKSEPMNAIILRQKHAAIIPGYHMNKKHWNTVINNGTIEDEELIQMIDESYKLVCKSLTKKDREKVLKDA